MHVLNWRQLDSYCTSLTARGQKSSTFTANWILHWQYKQTRHRMCLIDDWIRIVNRLALLTMQCQLSNVRITVSGLMGHNIFLEALHLMLFSVFWEVANCWVNIRVKAKCECTKETIDYQCAVETMESHKLLKYYIGYWFWFWQKLRKMVIMFGALLFSANSIQTWQF